MAFLRSVARLGALIGFSATCLQAQGAHARVIVAPQGRPRVAFVAPPPPRSQPLTTYGQTIFTSYPTIVTPDGRILVDLGNGYEEVARNCPYAYGYGCQSLGYPIAPQTPLFQQYAPPVYVPPRYAPPAYGAPVYPTPTYPPSGYYGYGYTPPQPPSSPPPSTGYGGCPPGYVPTGSYPPCVDPYRAPVQDVPMPVASSAPRGAQAAPRRQTAGVPSGARVVRRP